MKHTKLNDGYYKCESFYVMMSNNQVLRLFVLFFWVLFMATSCQETNLEEQNPILTVSNEKELGNRLYDISMSTLNTLDRSEYADLYNYLESAMNMAIINTRIKDKFDWGILVYEDYDNYNIFSLPGGKVLISTGMLTHLQSEHQLMAILAHEIYFADRMDQNDTDDLSLVMQMLKLKFGEYGTKTFLEVIDGTSETGSDMIIYIRDIVYEPYQVFSADDFALGTICENYLYSPYGLEEVLGLGVDLSEFIWLDNRPPGRLSQGGEGIYTLQNRFDNIVSWYAGCGNENVDQYITRYNSFIDPLR